MKFLTTIFLFLLTTTVIGKTLKVDPDRVIAIKGDIIPQTMYAAHIQLNELIADSKEPITLLINSRGGYVTSGATFMDAIRNLKAKGIKFNCITATQAMSAAFFIFDECQRRYALHNARLMWHPFRFFFRGAKGREIIEYINVALIEEKRLAAKLRKSMGLSKKFFYKSFRNETVWPAKDLHKHVPDYFTLIDSVDGIDNLFVEHDINDSIFGRR